MYKHITTMDVSLVSLKKKKIEMVQGEKGILSENLWLQCFYQTKQSLLDILKPPKFCGQEGRCYVWPWWCGMRKYINLTWCVVLTKPSSSSRYNIVSQLVYILCSYLKISLDLFCFNLLFVGQLISHVDGTQNRGKYC